MSLEHLDVPRQPNRLVGLHPAVLVSPTSERALARFQLLQCG